MVCTLCNVCLTTSNLWLFSSATKIFPYLLNDCNHFWSSKYSIAWCMYTLETASRAAAAS